MGSLQVVDYHLDIYAGVSCWRGLFFETNARRISDVLNDSSHPFVTLEKASQLNWDNGAPGEEIALDSISFIKRNAVAVVANNAAHAPTAGSSTLRIIKTPHRIVISAPPVQVTGNIHLVKGADLLKALEATHIDFIPLTSASLRWLDGRAPLPNSAGLIFINRQQIACVQDAPLDPRNSEPEILDAFTIVAPLSASSGVATPETQIRV